MSDTKPTREQRQKAGHYEILGETLAKFEFFEAGWNPYQRYLDVDKVDFILRRREDTRIVYREVQVKYGKLYDCTQKWERPLFDISSWRFFKDEEFQEYEDRDDFFMVYVLAHDTGYAQDIFVFPIRDFCQLLRRAVISGEKRMVWISRAVDDPSRWFFRLKRGFKSVSDDTCVDVSSYRRNFQLLR